jgi:hypothetical protein
MKPSVGQILNRVTIATITHILDDYVVVFLRALHSILVGGKFLGLKPWIERSLQGREPLLCLGLPK